MGFHTLLQGWAVSSPRARCGPRKDSGKFFKSEISSNLLYLNRDLLLFHRIASISINKYAPPENAVDSKSPPSEINCSPLLYFIKNSH